MNQVDVADQAFPPSHYPRDRAHVASCLASQTLGLAPPILRVWGIPNKDPVLLETSPPKKIIRLFVVLTHVD
jgi:hypothetical protein